MEQFNKNLPSGKKSESEFADLFMGGLAISPTLTPETRTQMSRLIGAGAPESHADSHSARKPGSVAAPAQSPVSSSGLASLLGNALAPAQAAPLLPASGPSPIPSNIPTWIPGIITLVTQIRQELETHITKLLSLNPSRREAVAHHLDLLAGNPPGPSSVLGTVDAAGGLRRWIEGPRSPAQTTALQIFFEEVALVAIGQALVLKAWADRGLRPWKQEDLGRLNWALGSALKPHIPIDREGWQITRPNLYSWYNPSPAIQRDLWSALQTWHCGDEGPALLAGLMRWIRQAQPELPEYQGYDERFCTQLWGHLTQFGFDPSPDQGPLKRRRTLFSPTLRDGMMVRCAPSTVNWIGLESNPFQLLVAELIQLWSGPAAPPLWAIGSGLEVHARDQLQLALGAAKPSLVSRIAEMEACDLAWVLEERCIRLNGRSADATRFREQVDSTPYFKKLRVPTTTLGDLQACVALTKLRPGAMMIWAREEPLSIQDGTETLNFFLERARLLCEWDLSEVTHSLPGTLRLFPKYLYLFVREPNMQQRLEHRPTRIRVRGQIRSHIEYPLFLGDVLQAWRRKPSTRGQWQIHAQVSPTAQKDWAERWPDPAAHDALRALEELRLASLPLASVTTVRTTPQGDPKRDHAWSVPRHIKGIWLYAEQRGDVRRLVAAPLPRPEQEARGSGYLVLLRDESWVAPLSAYFESECVHQWLEHHAERRGERWVLSEQIVKFIPVPKLLLEALGAPTSEGAALEEPAPLQLPEEWQSLMNGLAFEPKRVSQKLGEVPLDLQGKRLRAALFVQVARALEQLRTGQNRLLSLVGPDGTLSWSSLLDILPKSECVAITLHPLARFTGTLPPHLPIGKIDRVKAPTPGILFATESGLNLHVSSENPRVIEMIWDQLEALKDSTALSGWSTWPTWNELAQYLRLPRRVELAEATASEILKSHGEISGRLHGLTDLLASCSVF